jgi:hypothetical protein
VRYGQGDKACWPPNRFICIHEGFVSSYSLCMRSCIQESRNNKINPRINGRPPSFGTVSSQFPIA